MPTLRSSSLWKPDNEEKTSPSHSPPAEEGKAPLFLLFAPGLDSCGLELPRPRETTTVAPDPAEPVLTTSPSLPEVDKGAARFLRFGVGLAVEAVLARVRPAGLAFSWR
jgi:hypothetical protein